ncbi:MAG: hypothetical protein ACRDBH_05985, partial [Bosea sp. (in: a-proteobacteria)]
MAALAPVIHPTVAAIYRAYESKPDAPRPHLGASVLGRECERALWYSFRWAHREAHSGQKLRLFARGHREEQWFAADLRAVGVTLHTIGPDGKQFNHLTVGGHVGGSMDGAGIGFAEAPKSWHVVEFKTHGDKSYRALESNGVKASKPEHWAQVQLYMHWTGMDRAFYLAVNKNTDELYSERIELDRPAAQALEKKGERIVTASEPLTRINESPEFFVCKMCPASQLCHSSKNIQVNCRTCLHATPELDGDARWSCALHKRDLSQADQLKGCDGHRLIPALLSWATPIDGDAEANWVKYKTQAGTEFCNGGDGGYSSVELAAGSDVAKAIDSPDVRALRAA